MKRDRHGCARRVAIVALGASLAALQALSCDNAGVVLDPQPSAVRIDSLAAGPYHSCGISGGRLLCWGSNDHGELGVGDVMERGTPSPVAGDDWAEIVAGEQHTCARRTGGSLWCWGDDTQGQLGIGPSTEVHEPAFVSMPAPVAQLGCTYSHTCAVDDDHDLYCWGANEEGQLAQDDPFPGPGVDHDRPVRVGTDNDWLLADAGQGHTCGIRAPGTLWCWGRNLSGELGLGAGAPGQIRVPQRVGEDADWTDVRVGQNSSCGLRGTGELYCWGVNDSGEVGVGDLIERDVPARVGNASDWISITLDTFHACGVRSDGSLYCWGRNEEGQLGLGDTAQRLAPARVDGANDWALVAAGRFHTCALKVDGSVHCTGENNRGQLGLGDDQRRAVFTPLMLPAP